jgi:transcriptional regulator with PAS, ATPase and Fis domain
LFGHERGAFTGAYEVHHGLFERAEKGTLFLDEVDSLPLAAQARLLRVLQEGEFDRVGGKQSLRADVRVIAAGSNRLAELVTNGGFRKDLFYRLNVVPINIPPLRERPEDISPLVDHFLAKLSVKYGKEIRAVSQAAMMEALAYDWPGNIRELENVLERSFLFSPGNVITKLMVTANGKKDKEFLAVKTLMEKI